MSELDNIQSDWLNGATSDYRNDFGFDLVGRWNDHSDWTFNRYENECESYAKVTLDSISPTTSIQDRGGRPYQGINLASQEYLSLASHPQVKLSAWAAIEKFGVHSAGSAALMGNTSESVALESELADFLCVKECTVFSTGWGAGYGCIKTLVRPHDHVVIDVLAHASLQEATKDSTSNIHYFRHLSTNDIEAKLKRIRAKEPDAGILVVTETVFSMDSDVLDIAAIQALCKKYDATLFLDVAHDLGAMGPTGHGHLGIQNMVGKVDIVMGSFSKSFASNGGFVACNNPALKIALRYNCGPLTFTNAITPIAAGIVRECLKIVKSPEGAERRAKLLKNAIYLRQGMQAAGFEVLGQPSAIVPVILGSSGLSSLATKHCLRLGGIVNLVEYPAVSKNTCRWRLQVMADHNFEQLDRFVDIAVQARKLAQEELVVLTEAQAMQVA
jgi:glycine C-acetyltransferase